MHHRCRSLGSVALTAFLGATAMLIAAPAALAGGPVQPGGSENRLCASSNFGEVSQEVTNCSPAADDDARDFSHNVSADTASARANLRLVDGPSSITIGTGGSLQAFGDGIGEGDDRQESASVRLSRAFTVTAPVPYRIAPTLAADIGSAPFGDRGSMVVTLIGTESGSGNVFEFSRARAKSTSAPPDKGALTGTLQPGDYSFVVEGHCQVSSERCTASWNVTLAVGSADADGDALLDDWESNGLDADNDGVIDLDLAAMGADPQHKDIFVELDFMPPHRFEPAAATAITKAFADAPVTNPDATTGITLHLDNGASSVMDPRTGALWGTLSRQTSIAHQAVTGSVAGSQYDWSAFDTLKAAHFQAARVPAFHYAISAHGHDGTSTGIARDIPSSDLLVSLGAGCLAVTGSDCTLDASAQAGTLMHELGHNLGLHHGGDDELPRKPNYLSVMNYSFQLTGLLRSDLTFFLDYSRFSISLNESALDQAHGLGASGPAAALITMGRCPSGAQTLYSVADGPTDFDCDSTTGGTVAADINGDGLTTALPPFVDWPALVFDGGAVGGSGVDLPSTTPLIEPPLAELQADKEALEAAVAAKGGSGGTSTPSSPTATDPLALTSLRLRPTRLRAARRGPSIGRRGGTVVSYTLTRAARVRFKVERLVTGRRRAGRCRPPKQAPRGRRCTRRIAARGTFTHTGTAGTNTFRFTGRLANRTLPPGGYVLVATPIAADGTAGSARRAAFTIRR